VLVLRIDGKGATRVANRPRGPWAYMGPFLISHAKFAPSFKIFAHKTKPQIPWGVTRLEFRDEQRVFAAIAPRGPHAGDANMQQDFESRSRIAFVATTWERKAGRNLAGPGRCWQRGRRQLRTFHFVCQESRADNPNTQMAASPKYDDATMKALIDYFRTFIPQETP